MPAMSEGPAEAPAGPVAALEPTDKAVATAVATAALEGIVAVPSRDDRGRRTVVLSRAHWTKEVLLADLAQALAELREAGG